MTAKYPNSVWDGSGVHQTDGSTPTAREWDAIVAEVQAIEQAAIGVAGTVEGAGVSVVEAVPELHKTVISIANLVVTITDSGANGAHGGQKIYNFPDGLVHILGATTDLAIVAGAGGISDTAAVVAALGEAAVATDNATLTGGEASVVPSTAATLSSGAGNFDGQSTGAATLDGTATASDLHLNFAIPDVDVSASDDITVNGTITLLWTVAGDH